ncbi:MAG: HEAT repeat domain-containing protein [bacterium]
MRTCGVLLVCALWAGAGEALKPPAPRPHDEPHRVVEAIARLRGPDRAARLRALKTIQRFPERAIPFLIKASRSDDRLFRARVTHALGLVGKGDRDALWALETLLEDPDPLVRREAIAALANAGDASHIEAIRKRLGDRVETVRADAVEAIAELDPANAVDNMRTLLDHSGPRVRRAALGLLVERKPPGLEDTLYRMLDDKDGGVRGDAAAALADCVWQRVVGEALQVEDAAARERLYRTASRTREDVRQAAEAMMQRLDDPDPYARAMAVRALKQFRAAEAVPRLVELLRTEQVERVRSEVISALGILGGSTVVPALASQLDASSTTLRQRAALALGLLRQEARAAVPKLILLLGDREPRVRQKADLALRLILGTSVGYKAGASEEARQEAIRKWEEVWRETKGR